MKTEHDFTKGSVVGNIVNLAVPMTVAQLINVLYNIVDRIYIGHLSESLALTGLGLCLPMISAVSAFANLFGMGGAPLCSIERGKGHDDEAEAIMGNSFFLLVLFGVGLTVLGLLFKKPLLYLFGASDATFPYADAYLTIYLLGSVFVMTGLGMNNFINAQGFARTGMLTVLLGAAANIVLDPIFIFVLDMGVQGAALATVLSQMLSAVWIVQFLSGKKTILRLKRSCFRLQAARVRRIVGLGTSGFTMSITNCAVQIMCNATLQTYGGDVYVGVMTVINSVREVVTMPVNGLTGGAQPVMGYNYGAGDYKRVKQAIVFSSVTCIGYSLLFWVLVHLFPGFFIGIFNQEEAMLAAGIPAMQLYFSGFYMQALQFAGQAVFVALGKSRHAIFFSLLRKAVVVIPLTLWLPTAFGLGTDGVFLAEPISNYVGGLACFGTMLLVVWLELSHGRRKD